MSLIKKLLPVLIMILAIACMVFAAGCSFCASNTQELAQTKDEAKTSETVAVANTTAVETKDTLSESEVNGVIYENDLFSILQPDGWKVTESPGGVLFESGDVAIMVNAGDDTGSTEAFLKELMGEFAKQYNGTPVEEVTMFGGKFFQSRGTLEGKDTTYAYGLTNGLVVNLAMIGKDHPNNVEIKAILESLKFK
jgi:hypothetical protein